MEQIQILKNTVYLEGGMCIAAKERTNAYKADEVDARIRELEEQVKRFQRIIVIGGHASAEFKWRFAPEVELATEALKEGENG